MHMHYNTLLCINFKRNIAHVTISPVRPSRTSISKEQKLYLHSEKSLHVNRAHCKIKVIYKAATCMQRRQDL